MKKTLKTAAAFGLTAATIITGLSVSPAAMATTPSDWTQSFTPTLSDGSLGEVHVSVDNPDASTPKGLNYSFTAPSGTTISSGPRYRANDSDWARLGGCSLNTSRTTVSCVDSSWAMPARTHFDVAVTLEAVTPLAQRGLVADGVFEITGGSAMPRTKVPLAYVAHALFAATVDSVDLHARTAVLGGHGKPGATVIVNGVQEVDVEADGTWSSSVSGLTLGVNTVPLEQWENGEKTDETSVEVDLAVAAVTASTSFPADYTQEGVTSGTAHPGATVVIEDADGTEIDRAPAGIDGTWSMEIPAPNAGGDYTVSIHQEIDGEANGQITETITYGAAVTVTRPVPDAAHDGGPVTMRGTGEPGARVDVREEGSIAVIGSETVLQNGTWNLTTTNVDDRKHTLVTTQTGKGNNVTTSTIVLNPDANDVDAPTVETPEAGSTVTTSRPTFTGHGHDGATITIGYGPNSIIGTGTVVDGEWTIAPTRGLGMGVSNLVVTQTAGADVQTLTHTLTRVAVEQPLRVTSHVDGQTYAEGTTTFRGTAPVGSAIRATNQWGTVMGTATATDGTWSFNRNLGPTTAGYDLTFVATPPVGDPQTVSLKLHYQGALAFEVTSPVNDSTYTVGTTTFTGTAAPNTAVTATNQWGTPMGSANTRLGTTWAFDRYLGPTSAGYDITFVATKGADVQRSTLHLNTAVVNVPVAVTSIADGATYRPGLNVLAGTGTPGATVEAVNATNGWNVPMGRATVKADGTWALPERNWGPSNDYAIQVTQTNPDKTTSTTTVTVKAPVFEPLVLTSPAVGDTYDTGVAALFEGTATPFAAITVRSAQSSAKYRTVHADADGNWSFTRVWGPTHDYVLNIEQRAKNGQADAITGFAWNHSGN